MQAGFEAGLNFHEPSSGGGDIRCQRDSRAALYGCDRGRLQISLSEAVSI